VFGVCGEQSDIWIPLRQQSSTGSCHPHLTQ